MVYDRTAPPEFQGGANRKSLRNSPLSTREYGDRRIYELVEENIKLRKQRKRTKLIPRSPFGQQCARNAMYARARKRRGFKALAALTRRRHAQAASAFLSSTAAE